MRPLGTLASADSSTSRPAFFVVIHDAETLIPSAVLSENLLLEELAGVVWFQTQAFQVDAILSDLKVKASRPQQLGSGLIRREASFSVLSNQNTTPYVNGALTKAIWSGGKGIDSVLFSIWGVDIASITNAETKDITGGVCFGYFKLDSSTSWDEESRTCVFNLIDVTLTDDRIVAGTDNAGARTLLTFNTEYNAKVIPTVYGAIKRIKTLRGYPDISLVDSVNKNQYFSGTVGADYTALDTTIVLESPSYDSSILRQLISIGSTSVRVRMEDDEVISGTLSYDSGNNRVLLTGCTRNTFYYTGKAYTSILASETSYDSQPKPVDYDIYYGYYQRVFALSWSPLKLVLTDAVSAYSGILWNTTEIAKSGYGYVGLHASFPGSDTSEQFVFAKLTQDSHVVGTQDNKSNTAELFIETDILKGAYNTPYRLSSAPFGNTVDDISQVAIGSYKIHGTTLGFVKHVTYEDKNNLLWYAGLRNSDSTSKTTPYDQINLYFKNPILGAGSGTSGVTSWSLIHYSSAVTYNHYLNNGYTSTPSKIYGVGEDGLIEIPSSFISAIENGVAEYGYTNLIRVKLTTPPTGMGIGLVSNDLYVDCNYLPSWGADRHKILYEILADSRLVSFVAESNLNPTNYTGSPDTSISIGVLCSGETYTEVVDKLLFQLGETLRWNNKGSLDWYSTISSSLDGSGLWTGSIIDSNNLYDNTAALHLSKYKSLNIDQYREYLPYYLEVSYGGWADPFYKRDASKDSIGQDEVYLEYNFDYIQTKSSALTCINNFKKLGSASGIYATGRSISVIGGLQQLAIYEPLDTVLVNNYPSITEDSDLTPIMHRSASSIQYDLVSSNFILQGICLIDTIEYNLSISEVSVSISCSIAQYDIDARGIKLSDPPSKLGTIKDSGTTAEANTQSANYIAGGLGSSIPPGETNSIFITDENDVQKWLSADGYVYSAILRYNGPAGKLEFIGTGDTSSILAYDPVSDLISFIGASNPYQVLTIGDTEVQPTFRKIDGKYIDPSAIPCISSIQLVNNSGVASHEDPGTSVLDVDSLWGTTLTFDCSAANNPIEITIGRNETPDEGLHNGDDIELHFGIKAHTISSLHLVQMPAASIWCNPLAVTGDSAISVSALDNTLVIRRSGGLVWDQIDTDEIKDLAINGDKIDGGAIENYHIVSVDWSKITNVPGSFTPGVHASTHLSDGSDPLSIPPVNSFVVSTNNWLSGVRHDQAIDGIPFQNEGALPEFARLDKEIEIITDSTPFAGANHLQIKDNSITSGKIISVDWSKISGFPGVTLSGDVTGSTSANTVTKIQGYSVSNTNPDTNGNNLGGSLLVYSAVSDTWVPVKVFASASGTAPDASIQGGILCGVYKTGGERTIGSTDGVSDTSTGYLLGIDTSLQTVDARPKWLRDVKLGQGEGATSSTAGRMRIVCGTDGDYIDLGVASTTARIAMFDRSVSTSVPLVDIDLSGVTPTGGWTTTKKLKLKEVDVCDSGTAKKMLILASDPY